MLLTPKLIFIGVIVIFGILFFKNMVFGENKEASAFCVVAMVACMICLYFMKDSVLNTVLFKI